MYPESGAPLFEAYRRVLLKRFPFMLVCSVSGERIEVLALIGVRREPAWIKVQVGDRAGD